MSGNEGGADLSAYRFVKRIALGGKDLNEAITERDREEQIELLNKCLNGSPQGKIIALEVSTRVFKVGDMAEHHISMQMLTYHVGFERKPPWLNA